MSPLLQEGPLRAPAGCEIYVDDQKAEDLYPYLLDVSVDVNRCMAAEAVLRLESGRDEGGRWPVQDREGLVPGARVTIDAVFGERPEEVFRGFVREVSADYPGSAGGSTVTVTCQDASLALDRVHRRRVWGEDEDGKRTSDDLILKAVLSEHSDLPLRPHPDNQGGASDLVLLQDDTDAAFLFKRAAANGYELRFSRGQVYFGPPRLGGEEQPPIMIYAGPDTNALSFNVRSDGHRPDTVQVDVPPAEGGEDGTEELVVEPDLPELGDEPAATGLDDAVWRLRRGGGTDAEELRARAQRRANELSLRVKAEGALDGSLYGHVLRAGEPVVVDGAGRRYSGTYYVHSVNHRFDADGYRQEFVLVRNALGSTPGLSRATSALAGVLA